MNEGWMRRGVLLCVASLATACAEAGSPRVTAESHGGETPPVRATADARRVTSELPTLMVENRSGSPVAVYLDGARIGTATTGRSCILIPRSMGELRLVFATPGSAGFRGPIAYLEESRHWHVEFAPGVTIKYDVIGMAPSHESCAARDVRAHGRA